MSFSLSRGNRQGVRLPAPHYETHQWADSSAFAFYDKYDTSNPFRWHYHPELELIYWPTASGMRMAGDSIENFDNGDLCLIGSNLPHTWYLDIHPDRPERNIQIQFPPDCLGQQVMNLPEFRPLKSMITQALHGLVITGPTRERVARELLLISANPTTLARRFCRIFQLLVDIAESNEFRPLATSVVIPSINSRVEIAVAKVLAFVNANIDADASQAKAADLVNMSPAAFSRFFRKHFAKTYVRFVIEMRISRACTALLQTDQSISEIAYNTGFESLSHFNEQFRKLKGMSPKKYRLLIQTSLLPSASRHH